MTTPLKKKHYCAVAEVFYNARRDRPACADALATAARSLADYFQSDNPKFDRARFLRACGAGE